ncbi:hypothetical protein [Lutibacter sp.]|uniref:hypothetical protein n=1 Tax=Lutibacter sp. TaxID=1925666 RepID=UPI00299F27CB|nr:hypothetical protein [Lutibacter sp.]
MGTFLYFSSSDQNRFVIIIIFASLGLIVGLVKVLLISSLASSKSEIFKEAIKMYKGKMNIYGKPEFIIKDRKIILDYDTGKGYLKTIEYIITNVDLTDLNKRVIEKCKMEFDTIVVNNRIYAIFYSSWGYKGKKYKERIERKIDEINKCIEKNTLANNV